MKCPTCNVDLVMADRQGIEIDYCPQCRGVWLDRGELDKMIERVAEASQPRTAPPPPHYPQGHPAGAGDSHYGYQHKRKKSWFGDLFD